MSNNSCSDLPVATASQIGAVASQLAQAVGANANCVQSANINSSNGSNSSENSTNANTNAAVTVPLIGGGAGANATFTNNADNQQSYDNLQQQMNSSGCGALFVNAQNIVNASNQIQCQITSCMNSSSTSVSQGASINITAGAGNAPQPLTPSAQLSLTTTVANLANAVAIQLANPNVNQNTLKVLQTLYQNTLNSLNPSATLTISNSSLNLQVSGTLQTTCSITSSAAQNIAAAQQTIASETAKAAMSSISGDQALPQSQVNLINNSTQTLANNSTNNIQQSVNTVSASVNTNGSINLSAPSNINLNYVTFDVGVVANLMSNVLINDAVSYGLQVASTLSSSNAQSTTATQVSNGADSGINAGNQGNQNAINAGGNAGGQVAEDTGDESSKIAQAGGDALANLLGSSSTIIEIAVIAIIALLILFLAKKLLSNSSKSK